MKLIRGATIAVLLSCPFFGQTTPPRLEFEVASIKPSATPTGQVNVGVHIDGSQVRCTYLSLKDYIRIAYQVKEYQISGEDWLASERFDISAKLPAGGSSDQVRDMVKALLLDRFGLKLHTSSKEFPVYALVVGKGGSKLKESPPDPAGEPAEASKGAVNVAATGSSAGVSVDLGKGSSFTFANGKLEAKKLTMVSFADTLARFVDRPVVDMTEQKGNYDLTLQVTPEDYRAMLIRSAIVAGVLLPPEVTKGIDGAPGDSLYAAIAALGLKLDPRRAPLEVLVIDHCEKTPTDN